MVEHDTDPDRKTAGHQADRAAMLRAIEKEAREVADWLGKDHLDPRVLAALSRVPRHRFVPLLEEGAAYENRPLPIGARQTISQPFIVAVMSDQAEIAPGAKVLEVGTGSGYQAAVLAELGAEVYSLEVVPSLAAAAAERLARLGYDRVHCREGDGAAGWPEAAPFDAILVTAAAHGVPPALIDQLAPGGRLIIPVEEKTGRGPAHWFLPAQSLLRIDKAPDESIHERSLFPVAFVPLTKPQGR